MSVIGTQSPQQTAVYRAEARCTAGETFASLAEAQRYIFKLQSSDWWEWKHFTEECIEVQSISGQWSFAQCEDAIIGLAVHGYNERTVLHEVAHVLTGSAHGHNGPFVRTTLELTYLARGSDAYLELLAALNAEGADVG